jgi:hypothetical protein
VSESDGVTLTVYLEVHAAPVVSYNALFSEWRTLRSSVYGSDDYTPITASGESCHDDCIADSWNVDHPGRGYGDRYCTKVLLVARRDNVTLEVRPIILGGMFDNLLYVTETRFLNPIFNNLLYSTLSSITSSMYDCSVSSKIPIVSTSSWFD